MKDINDAPGKSTFNDIWQTLCSLARQGMQAIGAMSWPTLLACAIGLAIFMTILPLVLTLFVVFLLFKWASNADGFCWSKKPTPPQ